MKALKHLLIFSLLLDSPAMAQTFTNLRSLNDNSTNGGGPIGQLLVLGNKLYGTAIIGGTNGSGGPGSGVVFAMNTDGTGYSNIVDFNGTNGNEPWGGLVASGNRLYGTTYGGGTNGVGDGCVFAVNTDGTSFSNLVFFPSSTSSNGQIPKCTLVLSADTLYGTTFVGGTNGNGVIFSTGVDGSAFTVLHVFSRAFAPIGITTNTDGINPVAGLVLTNGEFYGTATAGGPNGSGTIFELSLSGSVFSVLHDFSAYAGSFATNSDGRDPSGGVICSANVLYGAAENGGTNGAGTLFAYDLSNSQFSVLHTFTSNGFTTNIDGANPQGALAISGTTLYGTAYEGGQYGAGTLFSFDTASHAFNVLHNFRGYSVEGSAPESVVLYSNTLYGISYAGGTNVNEGTVFAETLAPQPIPLLFTRQGSNVVLTWSNPSFTLQSASNVVATFTNVPGATSPYTNLFTGFQQYFRLKD